MKLFPRLPKRNSGEMARQRLKLLLVSDKAQCSPEIIEMIKEDLAGTISKYMEIDINGIEIQLKQNAAKQGRKVPVLHANIPILNIGNKWTF